MSKLSNNKIDKKTKKDKAEITPVTIDKAANVTNVPDPKYFSQVFSGFLGACQSAQLGYVRKPGNQKYPLSVMVHCPDEKGIVHQKSPAVFIQLTSPKMAKKQVRFEFNPAKLSKSALEYLDDELYSMSGLTFYEWLHHGYFTRLDLCRDILDRNINDYFIHSKWSKVVSTYSGCDGKQQTINLGKAGNNQITAYDKALELYGDEGDTEMFRVEAKCNLYLRHDEFHKFKNPFDKVGIFKTHSDNPPLGIAHWRAFQDSIRLRGIANAIKRQPLEHRVKLRKAITNHPVTWWKIIPIVWSHYWNEAVEKAGLDQIPKLAPPLSYAYHMGLT